MSLFLKKHVSRHIFELSTTLEVFAYIKGRNYKNYKIYFDRKILYKDNKFSISLQYACTKLSNKICIL